MKIIITVLVLVTVLIVVVNVRAEELPNGNTIPDYGAMQCSCERQEYLDEWIYKLYLVLSQAKDVPASRRQIARILLQILENRYRGSKVCR